jgi:hypothetical protein
MTLGSEEQAVEENRQGEAGPDAEAGGIGQKALVKSLYGGSNRSNNHEEGTW